MKKIRFSIKELAKLSGLTERTVRYYMEKGLVDRPVGQRKAAYYLDRHLEQLRTVKRYREAGFSLERISRLMKEGEVFDLAKAGESVSQRLLVRYSAAEGLELTVDPESSGLSLADVRELAGFLEEKVREIMEEKERAAARKRMEEAERRAPSEEGEKVMEVVFMDEYGRIHDEYIFEEYEDEEYEDEEWED